VGLLHIIRVNNINDNIIQIEQIQGNYELVVCNTTEELLRRS